MKFFSSYLKFKASGETNFHEVSQLRRFFRFLFCWDSIGRPQNGLAEERGQLSVGDSGATSNTAISAPFLLLATTQEGVATSLFTGKPRFSLKVGINVTQSRFALEP